MIVKALFEMVDVNDYKVVAETGEDTSEKSYYIEGIFMQAEVVNGNKRMYPKKVLHEAVKRIMPQIQNNRLLGELNHPKEKSSEINPERACIKVEHLSIDGANINGRAKVLQNLPCGRIVHGLLQEGVSLGVSSRGFGDTTRNKDGIAVVNDPLILKTVDVVTDPSAPDAYVTAVMENREWVYEDGFLVAKEQDIKKLINEQARKGRAIDETFKKIVNIIVDRNF